MLLHISAYQPSMVVQGRANASSGQPGMCQGTRASPEHHTAAREASPAETLNHEVTSAGTPATPGQRQVQGTSRLSREGLRAFVPSHP